MSLTKVSYSMIDGAFVNVLDYGAAGDGITDDTAAIQDALDSGKSVYFPDGEYIITALTLTSDNVTLTGPGTLVKKVNVDAVGLIISGSGNIVTGLRFDGTAAAPTPNYLNDMVRIVSPGGRNRIEGCYINGSKGGGINIFESSDNIIVGNTILNTRDNNIIIANAGADNNLVAYNICDGTTVQNNIFITASADSSPNGQYVYNNVVVGNSCLNSADTNIESGYHAERTIISSNFCSNSVNPSILVRDGFGVDVIGNTVINKTYADQVATHDGIAVVPQNEPASYQYSTRISNNIVLGAVKRSAIYVGGSFVEVTDNTLHDNNTSVSSSGAGLVGTGVLLANGATDVGVSGNFIRRYSIAVGFNPSATPDTRSRIRVSNNYAFEIGTFASFFNVTCDTCEISNNTVVGVVTSVLNLTSASGAGQLRYVNNQITMPYFSGATPLEVNPATALRAIPVITDAKSVVFTVPETQFDQRALVLGGGQMAGTCTIQFADGTEVATFALGGATGAGTNATSKLIGTSGLLDSTGSGGFAGWSVFYDGSGNLIIQRRGTSTGSSTRYFKAVIRDAG